MEGKLDTVVRFINFDAIVPFFVTCFNQEFLLTIRRYLHNGAPKAMLNIYDEENGKMIFNEGNPKSHICFTEVNDACLIDSGIKEYS